MLTRLGAYLEASRCRRVEREVVALVPLLGGIRDPEMRLRRFAAHLDARAIDEAAWTVACLAERLACRDERVQDLGAGLLDCAALTRLLGERWVADIRAVLERLAHPAAHLFHADQRRSHDGDEPPPREPVGLRISLARQPVRRLLERLLFDPDPRVIRAVLGNPRLTEADVVKLAASRRAVPEALEVIALDGRWIAHYPVKVALANNPATPERVVVGLLPHLLQRDLRELSLASPHGGLRERAAALLARREQA